MKKDIVKNFLRKENKVFFKYFVLFFLFSVLVINWQEISLFFNYRIVFGLVSDFFQSISFAKIFDFQEEKIKAKSFEYSEKENSLEIPKIEIAVPLVFPSKPIEREKDWRKFLDKGAVHFPGSALPGQSGQTIILGHSAPSGWPKIKHDWIFTRLNELNQGDEIFVYFEGRKYNFKVAEKIFLDKGAELPTQLLTSSENMLILISCWPPGKNLKRIAVAARLN